RIDQDGVRDYVNNGFDIQKLVVEKCPTSALAWDAKNKELNLEAEDCVRCMHCIDMMPKALRPGVEKGATILIGGKAPIVKGAYLGWVLVPFMKMEPPYTEFKELLYKIWDWWDENAKVRERVGELIDRMGMRTFLKAVDLPPIPQMVMAPRSNPYYFWDADEVK
ncbi:MAG: dissimilatory-type sulfite reductase subunit alpha, partial [Chloroflexota bacterium]